jgi:biopolymer transport protein ExbD
VVFLLLVFFIYAMLSMSVHRGVRVQLPDGNGIAEPLENFVITITEDSALLVEGSVVDIDEAVRRAVQLPLENARVLIYGDRQANLGVAVELLSRLRSSGVGSVSFLVKEANELPLE